MINTIFYFPDNLSFEDYKDQLHSGEIADHTIVFSSGSKSIYKGGVQFGSMSYQDLATTINQIFEDRYVNLPIATETLLGAIKVGSGLDVSTDGLLSVDSNDIKNIINSQYIKDIIDNQYIENSYTLPVASSTTLGGIKVGNGLTISNGVLSVTSNDGSTVSIKNLLSDGIRVATITIDGEDNDIFAPTGESTTVQKTSVTVTPAFDSGTAIATINVDGAVRTIRMPETNPYDTYTKGEIDTKVTIIDGAIDAVTESVNRIDGALDEETTRLTNLVDTLDTEIQSKVESMFDDANWIQQNWPEGTTGSTSNFGEEDVEAYLQSIGVWARDNGITSTQWSTLSQKVDSIEIAVNAMSSDGNITEALRASIETAVEDEVASLDLATTYAKTDDVGAVLEWMYSGLKSSTASDLTYNNLVSAAKNNTNGNFGISALSTEVENIKNDYVAKANLSTLVEDDIQSSISGLALQSSLEEAVTTLGSRITTVEGQGTALAGLETRVTTLEDAGYLAEANLVAAITNKKDDIISQAGFVAESTYTSAMSGINTKLTTLEEQGSGIAGLTTLVNEINGAYVSQTELVSKIVDSKDDLISQAGLATSAEVNTAKTELSASIGDVDSKIVQESVINDKISTAKTELQTNIDNLSANVYTKSETNDAIQTAVAGIEVEGPDLSGYVKKAEIIASVNSSTEGSTIKIDADRINVGGITIEGSQISDIDTVIADKVTADYINALGITANKIESTEGSIGGWQIKNGYLESYAVDTYKTMQLSPSYGITVSEYLQNTTYMELKPDGSGLLASGGITWDTAGNMTISANGLHLDTSRDWAWSETEEEHVSGLAALLIGPKVIEQNEETWNIEDVANELTTSVLIASDTPRIDFYSTGLTYNDNGMHAMTGLYEHNNPSGWSPSNPYAYGIVTNANIVLDGSEVYVDSTMNVNGDVYSGDVYSGDVHTGNATITESGVTFMDSSNQSKTITWDEIYNLIHS